jgi:hypothetical protein
VDDLDVYEAVKELCLTNEAVSLADVSERLRSDQYDAVAATLDMLVVKGLLSPAGGTRPKRYRPAKGHEDINV